jgi:hypothetical protein
MADVPVLRDRSPRSKAEDPYVTRREFTKSLVLVSCAAFCANGALAAMAALEDVRSRAKTEPKKIGRVHDLTIGGSRPLPRIDLERKGDELWAVALRK